MHPGICISDYSAAFPLPMTILEAHEWLKDTRLRRGLTQPQIELETAKLGARITQGHLSKVENGNRAISTLGPERMEALRVALGVSPEEWAEHTGLRIVVPVATVPRLRPLPEELTQMIDEKGHLAEELLTERWQQYLAGQRFSTGRATPERWWNLFLLLKNAGVEPGGN